MAKKTMTKTYCDFCEAEIEKSKPIVQGEVMMTDTAGVQHSVPVAVRLGSVEPRKRFAKDVCEWCVVRAAAKLVENTDPDDEDEVGADFKV